MIGLLKDGTVVVDSGPMLLTISVLEDGKPNSTLAESGARKALSLLEELARFRAVICQSISRVENKSHYPRVVEKMITSAKQVGDPTVTPLVGVAGAVADEVADFVFDNEAISKVIVNNGGDIAVRLRGEEKVKVGIKTDVRSERWSYVLEVDSSSNIGGIATSGFDGRSFTKGIATAAVAVATNASFADVTATLLGNATNIDSPLIERQLAEDIYPATDIWGHWVTTKVGQISQSEIEEAVENGLAKAREFQNRGLILGALIALRREVRITDVISLMISPA